MLTGLPPPAQNTPESEEFSVKPMAINSKADYEKLLSSSSKPVVVDFYAPWCGKCRQIGGFVDELVDKYPGVTFAKFDTTNPALETLAGELGVKVLPAFRFFKTLAGELGVKVLPAFRFFKMLAGELGVKVLPAFRFCKMLAGELGVKVLPAFRFFKGGKEVSEAVLGYKKKLLEEAVRTL
eukprot:gene15513-21603_t